MYITIFNSKNTTTKYPISPYDDHVSFDFYNVEVDNLLQMFQILSKNFILNLPIKIDQPLIKVQRNLESLKPYYPEKFEYIVIDIDDVKTLENRDKIIQYFKKYKCILGASRSYNGIDNFRMKGFLCVDNLSIKQIKFVINRLHNELQDLCDIDEAVSRRPTLNAPMNRVEVFLDNRDGEVFKDTYWSDIVLKDINNKDLFGTAPTVDIKDIKKSDLESIQADSIDELCLKVFQMMQFQAIKINKDGGISFKHPSERKSPGGYYWYKTSPYIMHHFNVSKCINIFDKVKKLKLAKELTQTINYTDKLLNVNLNTNIIQVNSKFLKVNSEIEQSIRDFINNENGLYAIRSPMGTGKSTIISHIISEAQNQDMRVLIITNRVSVAEDFQKKYNLKLYNKDKYKIGDSLICQYDSLHYYSIRYFDIVIMDEFLSLLLHSRNNINNSSANCFRFHAAFKKKLVIADAFLTGFENFILKDKKENLYLLDNTWRDPTELYLYEDFSYYVQMILKELKKGKITISSTSLNTIYSLQLLLIKLGYKVQTLTADTPQSTKELIYKLFENHENDKFDVLIYSPTLTVGVSNLNNVEAHFHFDSSMTTDVISSIQMLKRTRKAKRIHLYIKDRINFIKTNFDEIKDDYINSLGKSSENTYLFDTNDYGEVILNKIGKRCLQIDLFRNILEFNHKQAMLFMLKYHFLNDPKVVHRAFEFNILNKYAKDVKKNKELLLKANLDQFMKLTDLDIKVDANNRTEAVFNRLNDLNSNIVSEFTDPKCTVQVRKEILETAISRPSFIQNCRYYRILKLYSTGRFNRDDISTQISVCIQHNNNLDDLNFYNRLLKMNDFKLEDHYSKVSMKNPDIKLIVEKCGYKYKLCLENPIAGLRMYVVDPLVKKYNRFIKI